jgi:hypothetical protein
LGENHFRAYLRAVAETSADDVLEVAKDFVDPDSLVIVVVGEAARIREDLERIAPLTLVSTSEYSPGEEGPRPPGR